MLRLKSLRKINGMSREELGKMIGVSKQSIANYEQNINEPTLSNVIKISKIFNVTIDYLVGNEKEVKVLYSDRDASPYAVNERCIKEMDRILDRIIKEKK